MSSLHLTRLLSLPPALRSFAIKRALAIPLCQTRQISTSSQDPQQRTPSPQSSVSETEISHFNTLASTWWDPHGSSRLLHLMNPLRHKFLRQCLSTSDPTTINNSLSNPAPPKNLHYLDIGTGGGIFAETAARLPTTASVTAIDPSPSVIAVAKQHQRTDPLLLEPGRLTYLNTAIEDLPLPQNIESGEGGYDVISLFEVIEHIRTPSPFLKTCLSHLKPGGWLIGSTIARTSVSWFTTKFAAEEVLRLVPRGTHEWAQYIQPAELEEWARGQGELDVGAWRVMGVVYVPGFGWREVKGSEEWGNYFFGVRKRV